MFFKNDNRMTNWLFLKTKELWIRAKYHSINIPLRTTKKTSEYSPFFIMGSGRSGTTILRKILLQNDQIVIPPESGGLLEESIKLFINKNHLPWDLLVQQVLELWQKSPDLKYWNINGHLRSFELSRLPQKDRSLQNIISHIYLTYTRCHKPEAYIWGDKTPYATFGLNWIKKLYPQGRIIHMLRDGRDVVNSMIKHRRCDNIQQACARWNESVNILSKQQADMRIITVRYEQLVSDPKPEINRLSEFLQCDLHYFKQAPPVFLGDDHLSHHKNLKKELNNGAVGSWKNELDAKKTHQMTQLILPNLKKLGYV